MKKIWIRDIKDYEGKEVIIQGWLYNKRSSGKLHFLQLRDGTAEIQAVVFKGNVPGDVFELSDKITQESSSGTNWFDSVVKGVSQMFGGNY